MNINRISRSLRLIDRNLFSRHLVPITKNKNHSSKAMWMIRAISLKFNDWINGMISLESIDVARMTIQFPAHELNANPMNYVETLVYLIRWIWVGSHPMDAELWGVYPIWTQWCSNLKGELFGEQHSTRKFLVEDELSEEQATENHPWIQWIHWSEWSADELFQERGDSSFRSD